MQWQATAESVDITLVRVDRENRQRRIIETADLEASIKKRGQINPIIIDREGWLQAGERRLTACRNLGHKTIFARYVDQLSSVEAQILELEENIKRSDLDWQDLARGVARIHRLFNELDQGWTMGETAEECALTIGTVSLYLSVEAEMDQERIAKATTVREAYNMLARRQARQAGVALQELLDGPDEVAAVPKPMTEAEHHEVRSLKALGEPLPARLQARVEAVKSKAVMTVPEAILHTSFLTWAPQYSGPKFNLIHCDFPYGVELFSGPQGRGAEPSAGYKDSVDTYQTLLRSLCTNLDRVMSVSGHLMFWLSAEHRIVHQTLETFAQLAPTLSFSKFPLIWCKSDNAGIASDPRHGPRHVYELCLLASRGSRQIAKVKGDAYQAPTNKDLHPSTKPEPMLRHFMEMLVDETTSCLDPTCGSGASLRAAESLGANRVLGLEIDEQYLAPARVALKQARAKRAAERNSGGGL